MAGGNRDGLKPVGHRYDDALSRLRWEQLESLMAAYYRGQGYEVEHVGTAATGLRFDGGIDLKLRRDDAYVLVQCKHWNAKQVTHNAVHELLGIMVNEAATGAILVCSGEFTRAALEAAERQGHVQLIDGKALRPMLAPMLEAADILAAGAPSGNEWANASAMALAGASSQRMQPRRPPGNSLRQSNAGWWIVALVGTLVFVLLVRLLLGRTAWSAGSSPASPESPAAGVSAPIESVVEAVPVVAEPPAEVPGPPTHTVRPPTEAELRESQRKADEAMKVIEDSTPEI